MNGVVEVASNDNLVVHFFKFVDECGQVVDKRGTRVNVIFSSGVKVESLLVPCSVPDYIRRVLVDLVDGDDGDW